MKVNISKLNEFVKESFNGNKSAFANAIGVDRGQVCKVLKDGTCAGAHFFGGLIGYCEKQNLNYKDFVFLGSRRENN